MNDIPLSISIKALDAQFRDSLKQDKEDLRNLSRNVEDLGKRIDSEMNKAGITMSAFGKSSKDIGDTLSSSFDGFAEAIKRNNGNISQLGSLMDRISVREKELLKVRQDNFLELAKLKNQADTLSNTTIPLLQEKGDTETLEQAEVLLDRINGRIAELTDESKRAENEMERLSDLNAKASELTDKFNESKESLSGVSGEFNKVNSKYDDSINKHSTLAAQLRMVQAEMEEMIRLAQESGDENAVDAAKSSKEYKDLAGKAKDLKNAIATIKGKDAADGLTPLIRSITQVSAAFRNTKNPIAAFRAGMTALRGGMGLTKISIKGVISSLKALWASLLSNPITAIIALVAALVVGLVKLVSSIKSTAEKQAELNAQEKAHLELLQAKTEATKRTYDQAIKGKERELAVLKAGNVSLEEQYKLEDEIYNLKKEKADAALEEWSEEAASVDELNELLLKQKTALQALQEVNSGRKRKDVNADSEYAEAGITVNRRSVEIDGVKITKGSVEDMMEAVQGMVDNTEKKLEMGIKVKEDVDNLTAEAEQTVKKREKDQKDRLATERSITRETAKMRISLINDCYAREVAMAKQANKERKEDLERRLKEEKDLTEEARKQINEQIKLSEKEMNRELARLAQERAQRIIAIQRQIEDAQRTSAPRTSEEQRTDLRQTYDR